MPPYLPYSVLEVLHNDRLREFGYPAGDPPSGRARRPARRGRAFIGWLTRLPHQCRRLFPKVMPGTIAEGTYISLDALEPSYRATPTSPQYLDGSSGTSAGDSGRHCGIQTSPGSRKVKPSHRRVI
jgi:hypothetical protein